MNPLTNMIATATLLGSALAGAAVTAATANAANAVARPVRKSAFIVWIVSLFQLRCASECRGRVAHSTETLCQTSPHRRRLRQRRV